MINIWNLAGQLRGPEQHCGHLEKVRSGFLDPARFQTATELVKVLFLVTFLVTTSSHVFLCIFWKTHLSLYLFETESQYTALAVLELTM